MIALVIFTAGMILSCGPGLSGSLTGDWIKGDQYKYTFNDDGTYKYFYYNGTEYEERENGTYSTSGVQLVLNVQEDWDWSTDTLEDVSDENKVEYQTIGLSDTKLRIGSVYYGGDTETLIGTWESSYKSEDIDGYSESSMTITVNSDGTLTMKEKATYEEEYKGTYTWEEVADGEIEVTDEDDETSTMYYEAIGSGIYLSMYGSIDETHYYEKQ